MKVPIFVLGILAIAHIEVATSQDMEKPAFCYGLDCPYYILMSRGNDYELRQYQPSQWVTTNITGNDYQSIYSILFYRLFGYISGNNEANRKIAMTVPVLTRIIPRPNSEYSFAMFFYLSPTESSPPNPSEEGVSLISMPQREYYVKSYVGYANNDTVFENAQALHRTLSREGKNFTQFLFYDARYSGPYPLFNRNNEVWYIAN